MLGDLRMSKVLSLQNGFFKIKCSTKGKQYISLDIIRVISCLFIVLYHYTFRFTEVYGLGSGWSIRFEYGAMAVDVFFFLSGFLAIYNMRHQSVLKSIVTKIIRLYPAYWMCIVITTVFVFILLPEKKIGIGSVFINLTMLQSFFGVDSVDGAYWTMAYELVFYLIIAFCQMHKNGRKRFTYIALAWSIIALVIMWLPTITSNNMVLNICKVCKKLLILDRAYAFIIGCTVSYIILGEMNWAMFFSGVLSAVHVCVYGKTSLLMLCIALLVIVLIVAESVRNTDKNKTGYKIIHTLSSMTYSYYLLHQYIGYGIMIYLINSGLVSECIIIIPIIIVFILSLLVYQFIEKRIGFALLKKIRKK